MRRNILAYSNQLLPISETFVYNQTVRLKRYTAFFLGAKLSRGNSIPLPVERVYLINSGGKTGWIKEFLFKLLGFIPSDVLSWLEKVKPALIHAHFGFSGAVALPLAKQVKLPLVVSFHGTDATKGDFWVWRSSHVAHKLYLLRRRELNRIARAVVVQSDFLRDILVRRHGFSHEKVVVIRYGVDLNEFKPEGSKPEKGHILYVGRLVELKGLHYLLKAIEQIKDRHRVHLTIIGDGPMRAQYEAMAARILGTQFTFLGAQPQQVVKEYMKRAYLFCMPSITMPSGEAEALGMVFLEAMAMQVPPVSFRIGGIPEVIRHGETGFLARERDVKELAHYLELLLKNPELRFRMGIAGRRWVEQEFNLETQNAKLESLYDEVACDKSRA